LFIVIFKNYIYIKVFIYCGGEMFIKGGVLFKYNMFLDGLVKRLWGSTWGKVATVATASVATVATTVAITTAVVRNEVNEVEAPKPRPAAVQKPPLQERTYRLILPFKEPETVDEKFVFEHNGVVKYMNWVRFKNHLKLASAIANASLGDVTSLSDFLSLGKKGIGLAPYVPLEDVVACQMSQPSYQGTRVPAKPVLYQEDGKGNRILLEDTSITGLVLREELPAVKKDDALSVAINKRGENLTTLESVLKSKQAFDFSDNGFVSVELTDAGFERYMEGTEGDILLGFNPRKGEFLLKVSDKGMHIAMIAPEKVRKMEFKGDESAISKAFGVYRGKPIDSIDVAIHKLDELEEDVWVIPGAAYVLNTRDSKGYVVFVVESIDPVKKAIQIRSKYFSGKRVEVDRIGKIKGIVDINGEGRIPERRPDFQVVSVRKLTTDMRTRDESSVDSQPDVSPDGKYIAFTSRNRDRNPKTSDQYIYIANSGGANMRRLTSGNKGENFPRWSPNGKRIAFSLAEKRYGHFLYVVGADGQNRRKLTTESSSSAIRPTWSPDGKRIAFSAKFDGASFIYIINAGGTGLTKLAKGEYPRWSPNGGYIAYTSYRAGGDDIWRMHSDGTNQEQLTKHRAVDADSDWSPDGRHIAFISNRSGRGEVWVMGSDGTNPKKLTDSDRGCRFPTWFPDGKRIAYSVISRRVIHGPFTNRVGVGEINVLSLSYKP